MLDVSRAEDLPDDVLTVLAGTAKPMPTLPVLTPPVSIWVFTPMTSPRLLSSGPPELPLLIGASVWMTWSIVKFEGDWMSRSRRR